MLGVFIAWGPGLHALQPFHAGAQESMLDLAAMALEQGDLPAGYHQRRFDEEGYTPGHRMAAIQFGDQIPSAELEDLGIVRFYSSTFFSEDQSDQIYIYLTEYESDAAAHLGCDYFENESNFGFPSVESEDLPGPTAGASPKEITVSTDSRETTPFYGVDATFRVGRVLAGVQAGSIEGMPEVSFIEELATALEGRIATVHAGEAPEGVNFALSRMSLDLFGTWPWPGNSLEGYKSAEELLGADGGLPQFHSAYLGGYIRFASAGSVDTVVQHEPPYIDLLIAEFTDEESALGVLDASGELPTLHYTNVLTRTPVDAPSVEGADGVLAFAVHRDPIEDVADSFELAGYEVAFTVGTRVVTITVLGDVLDTRLSPEDLRAIALDLAEQQSSCLQESEECGSPAVPAPLLEIGLPATPIAEVR